ncbi:MAG: acetate kinase [Coriobacteriales bacterium]|jgi:acetate kinase|nr:acetate kinase [Coriobacteriales bacterium]
MFILVINAGSSSLKYQLFDAETREVRSKGLCERVGALDSFIHHTKGTDDKHTEFVELTDHATAVRVVHDILLDGENGVLNSLDEIAAIGHRVVHGGEFFQQSVIIDDDVLQQIEACVPLAPLHNPPALACIEACRELMPKALNVAVFDTAFNQTMPPKAYIYPLPYELYEQYRVRKYGFHGTSHRYVSTRAAQLLGRPLDELRIISCHLGSGCSLAAVDHGRCVDNTLGFTPLDGLMMGTRCGSIDPAIVIFLIREVGLSPDDAEEIMNKLSGFQGVSGVSNDLRDVKQAADAGNERAQLAYQIFANRIKKFIGAYTFEMGGVDAIIMTAGVGENDAYTRQLVFEGLDGLGIVLDSEKNLQRGEDRIISADSSQVQILVIPTNDELMIVDDVLALCQP